MLTEVDGLQAKLEELAGVVRGRVAIGAMWPTGNYNLAGTLATFHQRHPGVEIHMVEETADRLLEMLRADELDCAFASVDPDRLGDEFAATMLFEEQIVVAFTAAIRSPSSSTSRSRNWPTRRSSPTGRAPSCAAVSSGRWPITT